MEETRKFWVGQMLRIAGPVLENLSRRTLKEKLPLDFHADRKYFAPLEAFGRTACGIAPWLEASGIEGEEKEKQEHFRGLMLEALDAATDPASPDYMEFTGRYGGQPLVDAAFLAHALVRAPEQIVSKLNERVKGNLIHALRQTREIMPPMNNWLFFAAMVETGLFCLGAPDFDRLRIAYAAERFEDWYVGDGTYGDGADFHWDYYNSFVIQPMYVDIAGQFGQVSEQYGQRAAETAARASRYASVLERMIAPDGTYPIIGRSVVYRFGAFQLLSQAALEGFLDARLHPAQVRCALTAVIKRVTGNAGMFDADGWLSPGVCGCQPGLAEPYINRGSLYLCTAVFLALGLPPEDPFWSAPDEKWTSCRIWEGEDLPADHAI